jgi:hypothetical protein
LEKFQYRKADVGTVRVLNFVRTHGADVAEIIRLNETIADAERQLTDVRTAPRTIAEAVEIVTAEANAAAAEIDAWVQRVIFSVCRRVPAPYGRYDGEGGKVLLAFLADRIPKLGDQLVEPDDSMSKADREKKVAEISKGIEKNRAKIVKLLAGQDEGDIMAIIARWRNTQAMVASEVDPFGTELTSLNPFHSSYYQLGIETAKARPDFARYLPNTWANVDYFYDDFRL